MTVEGWVGCFILSVCAIVGAGAIWAFTEKKVLAVIVCIAAIALIFGGGFWYYGNTANGIRALTDQRANFSNGLERTVTVYTADGKVLAQYEGRIDIEQNDGGYVKFDFDGKRYIYYNCFVESIADLR